MPNVSRGLGWTSRLARAIAARDAGSVERALERRRRPAIPRSAASLVPLLLDLLGRRPADQAQRRARARGVGRRQTPAAASPCPWSAFGIRRRAAPRVRPRVLLTAYWWSGIAFGITSSLPRSSRDRRSQLAGEHLADGQEPRRGRDGREISLALRGLAQLAGDERGVLGDDERPAECAGQRRCGVAIRVAGVRVDDAGAAPSTRAALARGRAGRRAAGHRRSRTGVARPTPSSSETRAVGDAGLEPPRPTD